MDKVHCFSNVYEDENSAYTFEQLNEKEYLYNVLSLCKKKMNGLFDGFDFFIFSSHNNAIPASASLISDRKKILIYISDEASNSPLHLQNNYCLIFKSYLCASTLKVAANIFPFPLGYVNGFKADSTIKIIDRKYDLFFSGNLNYNRHKFYKLFTLFSRFPDSIYFKLMNNQWAKRKVIRLAGTDFSSVTNKRFIRFNSGFKTGLDISAYSAMLADSKIVLCPKGFESAETFRLTEALSCGCVVISERLPDFSFYSGAPIIQVVNWEDGLSKVKQILQNQKLLLNLQEDSVRWWKDKLSDEGVSSYMCDTIQNLTV